MPGATRVEEAEKDSSLEPSGGVWPCQPLVLDFWSPEQRDNTFVLFEDPELGYPKLRQL